MSDDRRGASDPQRDDATREADAVRREYARRAADPQLTAYYERVGPALERSLRSRRERTHGVLGVLGPPGRLRVLDLGCGTGADLAYLGANGFDARRLVGVDLLPDILAQAKGRVPGVAFVVADGADLPFADGTFDAVLQTTALSSIVDARVRARVASEIARITRTGGLIVSYDLRVVSDGNPRLVPLDDEELVRLFASAGRLAIERAGVHLGIASRLPAPLAELAQRVPALLRANLAVVQREGGTSTRERIATTYAGYARSGHAARWEGRTRGDAQMAAEREGWIVDALGDAALGTVVDVGCGDANVARAIERRGRRPRRYVGLDLLTDRLRGASARTPWARLIVGDAERCPLADACADAAVTSTLLSSLPDQRSREAVAAELARIVRPGGRVVVYDLRYPSPANPRVRPVGLAELRSLFPGWRLLQARTLTLLPPLARTSVFGGGPLRYRILASLPLLRSHLGVVLERPQA